MEIEMLDTVEDSHAYLDQDENGKDVVKYSVMKFRKGAKYNDESMAHDPAWKRRAPKLVKMGLAVEVEA